MNRVIVLAGGIGSRINSDVPKQFVRVGKSMMITYALKTLIKSKYVESICIVCNEMWKTPILEDLKKAEIAADKIQKFALPGKNNRQESILSGMRAFVKEDEEAGKKGFDPADTVLIHDAARPFLTEKMLEGVYKAYAGHEGVMPVLPMKDTVYLSEDGRSVSGLLDRSRIYAGQAPELFSFGAYFKANTVLLPDRILKINGSSEPAIMAGMDIAMIPGDEGNFKVTTDEDLKKCSQILEAGEND